MVKLFSEVPIAKAFATPLSKVDKSVAIAEIRNLKSYEVENLARRLSQQHQLSHLSVLVDGVTRASSSRDRLGREFPPEYSVQPHQQYPCVLVTYKYSISGSVELLSAMPTTRSMQYATKVPTARIEDSTLLIEYVTFYRYPLDDEQKAAVREVMHPIHEQLADMIKAINEDVDGYNAGLYQYILDGLNKRIKGDQDKQDHDKDL